MLCITILLFAASCAKPAPSTQELVDTVDISDPAVRALYIKSPSEIYTEPGSENGLAGKTYSTIGTITRIDEFILGDDNTQPTLWLTDNQGDLILTPAAPDVVPEGWNDLSVGDEMEFYFIYTGMSTDLDIGMGIYIGTRSSDPKSQMEDVDEEIDAIQSALSE